MVVNADGIVIPIWVCSITYNITCYEPTSGKLKIDTWLNSRALVIDSIIIFYGMLIFHCEGYL